MSQREIYQIVKDAGKPITFHEIAVEWLKRNPTARKFWHGEHISKLVRAGYLGTARNKRPRTFGQDRLTWEYFVIAPFPDARIITIKL